MKEHFKIRFWDKELKVMIYDKPFKRFPKGKEVVTMLGCEVNGSVIYEGDLIGSWDIIDGEKTVSKIPVVFDNGSFWTDLSFNKNGSFLQLLAEWGEPIKVIGNIYQNQNKVNIQFSSNDTI